MKIRTVAGDIGPIQHTGADFVVSSVVTSHKNFQRCGHLINCVYAKHVYGN
jgi:hypothetical protein